MNNFKLHKQFDSYESFLRYVNKVEQQTGYGYNLYFIMKTGYTRTDIKKANYEVELLQYECTMYHECYVWQNDWYEGQQFIDCLCVLTDDDIIRLIKENNDLKVVYNK